MKTNYFTKIEDKYVFNISLIFWHSLIVILSLSIIIAILLLGWSVIPPSLRKVKDPVIPEKNAYPPAVKVDISELNLEDVKEVVASVDTGSITQHTESPSTEDLRGKSAYEAARDSLKALIPPSKYSWNGSGDWSYPYGKRYWDVYQQDRYRQWVSTEAGLEDKIKSSFRNAQATNYMEKKTVIDGYIAVVRNLNEEKRLSAVQYLISQIPDNVQRHTEICSAIAPVASKMRDTDETRFVGYLAFFGKKNKNDGIPFIQYIATIIDKFEVKQRASIIEGMINGYYYYFNQNLNTLKEANGTFVELLSQIKPELQSKGMTSYYQVYIKKNQVRQETIAKMDAEYNDTLSAINGRFELATINAQMDFEEKKALKAQAKSKSITGIGGSILAIVIIASILVFLSIQRSVRRIEQRILANVPPENKTTLETT